jgi:Tir chaperone protein (CesT) family
MWKVQTPCMQYDLPLQGLGVLLGLKEKLGFQDGSCAVELGDVAVTLHRDDANERIVLSAWVSNLPTAVEPHLLEQLLALNLYWKGGVIVCMDPGSRVVLIQQPEPVYNLTAKYLHSRVGALRDEPHRGAALHCRRACELKDSPRIIFACSWQKSAPDRLRPTQDQAIIYAPGNRSTLAVDYFVQFEPVIGRPHSVLRADCLLCHELRQHFIEPTRHVVFPPAQEVAHHRQLVYIRDIRRGLLVVIENHLVGQYEGVARLRRQQALENHAKQ